MLNLFIIIAFSVIVGILLCCFILKAIIYFIGNPCCFKISLKENWQEGDTIKYSFNSALESYSKLITFSKDGVIINDSSTPLNWDKIISNESSLSRKIKSDYGKIKRDFDSLKEVRDLLK